MSSMCIKNVIYLLVLQPTVRWWQGRAMRAGRRRGGPQDVPAREVDGDGVLQVLAPPGPAARSTTRHCRGPCEQCDTVNISQLEWYKQYSRLRVSPTWSCEARPYPHPFWTHRAASPHSSVSQSQTSSCIVVYVRCRAIKGSDVKNTRRQNVHVNRVWLLHFQTSHLRQEGQ